MERNLLMSKDKKGRRWDGRSRISTPEYKKNYNEIFKKKKEQADQQSDNKELEKLTTLRQNIQTEIVNGQCPTCSSETVLVSIWPNLFRCMTCGTDLEQKVNGKISYIPNTKNIELRMKIDGQS